MSDDDMQLSNGDYANNKEIKLLTTSTVNSWCQLVTEQQSVTALTSLLNGYRSACHYGVESSSVLDADSCHKIQDSETFCEILMFMLNEADNLFRGLLEITSSSSRKEKVGEVKNSSKWNTFKPLIKSYLRSTLFLLNQATDVEILIFSLARVRASMTFFATFPSLLCKLIKVLPSKYHQDTETPYVMYVWFLCCNSILCESCKHFLFPMQITVHLWATGGGTLSSHAFLVIRDLASVFSSDCFDTCFVKTYKSFIGHCQFVEPVQLKHIEYLRNSFVELCSIDVQKSSSKAMVSICQLGKILHRGLQTKNKVWNYHDCYCLPDALNA